MHILTASEPVAGTPAYTANGVIGLRFSHLPLEPGWCTLSGYVSRDEKSMGEHYQPAPWPLGFEVWVDGVVLREEDLVKGSHQQSYCLSTGEFTAEFCFARGDVRGRVKRLIFLSRSRPYFAVQEVRVCEVSGVEQLAVRVGVDARGGRETEAVPGRWVASREAGFGSQDVSRGYLLWEAQGGQSEVGLAYHVEASGEVRAGNAGENGFPCAEVSARGGEKGEFFVRQVTALVPTQMHQQPAGEAVRLMQRAHRDGFLGLREANRAEWTEIWKGRIVIEGAEERWQLFLDAQFHYLHCALHRCSPGSTTLYGLGHWPGYHCFYGRVFWDVDTYAIPALSLLSPESVRPHFEYRLRHLEAARRNARLHGYLGAQYPWESNPGNGEEGLPLRWARMDFEEHNSFSIAYAFAKFAQSSGDADFLEQQAWPVLKNVAQWIVSRSKKTVRGFEILDAMGICEGKVSNNNSFVNMMASLILREALEAARKLGKAADARWEAVSRGLYIPRGPDGRIILFAEGADLEKERLETETLAAFFPYSCRDVAEAETMRHYLLGGMRGGTVGWPMLPPLYPTFAARLGEQKLLAELMERVFFGYVLEPWQHMDEFGKEVPENKGNVGPYLAHTAAVILNFLLGFTGMQVRGSDPRSWAQFPVLLPEGWKAVRLSRIHAGGKRWSVVARQGAAAAEVKEWVAESDV